MWSLGANSCVTRAPMQIVESVGRSVSCFKVLHAPSLAKALNRLDYTSVSRFTMRSYSFSEALPGGVMLACCNAAMVQLAALVARSLFDELKRKPSYR
jgi:hypothetical protein